MFKLTFVLLIARNRYILLATWLAANHYSNPSHHKILLYANVFVKISIKATPSYQF